MTKLSLEQDFEVRSFAFKVRQLNQSEAHEALVVMFRQMLLQQNTYKDLLKKQWGFADMAPIPTKKPP